MGFEISTHDGEGATLGRRAVNRDYVGDTGRPIYADRSGRGNSRIVNRRSEADTVDCANRPSPDGAWRCGYGWYGDLVDGRLSRRCQRWHDLPSQVRRSVTYGGPARGGTLTNHRDAGTRSRSCRRWVDRPIRSRRLLHGAMRLGFDHKARSRRYTTDIR